MLSAETLTQFQMCVFVLVEVLIHSTLRNANIPKFLIIYSGRYSDVLWEGMKATFRNSVTHSVRFLRPWMFSSSS